MKFKEIHIIRYRFFSGIKYVASYRDYMDDDKMLENFSTYIPRKGDVISVIDKNTHEKTSIYVKRVFIDFTKDMMTIWCK